MPSISFNTSNQTYRQLMGNGLIYKIPKFQRDYSWTETEWDDLWRDIQGMLAPDGESGHYMGYLVLQSSDSKNFEVIDGQQRLTTLSILILAVLWNINKLIINGVEEEKNKQRQEQLRNSFIGYLDPVTLITKPKLNLNRNNNALYQNYLVPLIKAPMRGLKVTEHLMRKAFDWFNSEVANTYGSAENGAVFAKFIDDIVDKLFFTVITVNDELNAFKVFETLNARGVRLSSTDLLKNYLFSIVYAQNDNDREINEMDNRWEALVGKLGSESFPDFLRTHWNSRNRFVRHSELFKVIREKIRDRGAVFQLLRNMEEDADIYAALPYPEDVLWTVDQKNYISELKMFGVRQVYSLLLAAYRIFSPLDFTQLLRACSIISFRYNIIGNYAANDQERVYHTLAERISNGEFLTFTSVIRELRTIYPNDEQFKAAFSEKQMKTTQSKTKRIVRYLLFSIEKHVSGIHYDFDSESYNIEHILPENPDSGWQQFNDSEFEQSLYRLGNMTIIKVTTNRSLGNQDFASKKLVFIQSEFVITRKIGEENIDWNAERIAVRQRWLAEQAKSIWKISQLSQ